MNAKLYKGTGQNNYSRTGPTFGVGGGGGGGVGGGVFKDTTNILLAFKFELTQIYSASKSRHY